MLKQRSALGCLLSIIALNELAAGEMHAEEASCFGRFERQGDCLVHAIGARQYPREPGRDLGAWLAFVRASAGGKCRIKVHVVLRFADQLVAFFP